VFSVTMTVGVHESDVMPEEHKHLTDSYDDKEWQEWKDYADQVSVQVRFRSWAGANDAEEHWLLQSDGAAWTKDWLSRRLINLAAADAANSCCGRGNYFLDTRDKKTEWGASGALFEALLTLSENLMSEATWVALGALGRELGERLRKQNPGWIATDEITEEQIHACAVWVVETDRKIPYDSLVVDSTEYLDGHVLVELHDPAGVAYVVEVQTRGDFVRLGRIRKVTRPGAE
jgi:hypothetical protein